MAVYKVPQDVEADDKLIGPFSFRQFIYLIVVAISGAGAWGLSTIFIPLAIIPMPFILFFAVLALPLRKDQPMETYLTAVVQFYFLKSRKRLWQPDGIDSFVTIIPPKDADKIRTKNLSEDEATNRLGYLANLVDSHGWSVRGAGVASPDTSINNDLYYESQQTADMMDSSSAEAASLTQRLQASANARKDHAIAGMQQQQSTQQSPMMQAAQSNPLLPPQDTTQTAVQQPLQPLQYNPTPAQYQSAQQRDAVAYAAALAEEAENHEPITTSETPMQPVTIDRAKERAEQLATRNDISIQTLSEEANRLAQQDKLSDGDEVTISLR